MHSFFARPLPLPDSAAKIFLIAAIFSFPISQAPAHIFMALCLVAWLVAGGYRERFDVLRSNTFVWSVLALVLLILLGTSYSVGQPDDIDRHIGKYLKLAFIPVAMTLLSEERWRRRGMHAFSVAMALTLLLSMLSLFVEIPFMKGSSGSLEGNHHVFKDHIAQNLMMAFFVLIMLVKGHAEVNGTRRWLYWAVALCGMINILGFVHGRTGYVALAAVLLIFLWTCGPSRRRLHALIGLVLAGAILLPLADGFRHRMEVALAEMQSHKPEKITSVGSRMEMAYVSWGLIVERPLYGWGTGAYRTKFCEQAVTENLCLVGGPHPHNQFLSFGVQLGLIGIFAYMVFLVTALQRAWFYPRPERTLALGLLGTLVVDSLFHAPFFLVGEAQFFILMLALVLARPDARRMPSGPHV